jgi:hypothetical protein
MAATPPPPPTRQEHTPAHTYTVKNDLNEKKKISSLFGEKYSKLSKAAKSYTYIYNLEMVIK